MTAALSSSDLEPPSFQLGSSITIEISDASGVACDLGPLENAVRMTMESHGLSNGEVSVLLTTDEHMRSLNLEYRGLDEPTDVLTFGAEPAPDRCSSVSSAVHITGSNDLETKQTPPILLGDIVISVPFAKRQAEARNIPLNLELCYLAIHGALHLIGFDDQTDDEREGMMREMSKMAVAAGLPADPEWSSILHSVEEAAR